MEMRTSLCKYISKIFPVPLHPFNLENQQLMTYAQWQYERGEETLRFYLDHYSIEDILHNKVLLDIGCGAAGKTLYYCSKGAKRTYGIDTIKRYERDSYNLAREKNLLDRFEFVHGDAAQLPFEENFFDGIIMNDAMEHVRQPLEVLQECYRVLTPGGKLYINFPPYYHPFGAHLSDAIGFPWVHVFFNDETLISAYKYLLKDLPDAKERINFRISKDESGKEYFSYINKMTIKKFIKLLDQTSYSVQFYNEVPLRKFLTPLTMIPTLKEGFVKMVVCVLEK